MKIDRRITNGLAWAGVLLVVGVPAADYVSGHFMGDRGAAPQVAVIEPTAETPVNPGQTAPAQVAANAAPANGGGAVDTFVQSGRKLPSYITGGSDAAAPTPQPAKPAVTPPAPAKPVASTPVPPAPSTPVATAPARPAIVTQPATDPVTVSAIPPAKVAPVPMPLSMRPRSVATVTQQPRTPAEQVIIPPNIAPTYGPDVSAEDLEDWETGPLSDFLARRDGGAQRARPQIQQPPVDPYYPNGGYLDQIQPQGQGDRYVGPVGSPFPFTN